MMGRLLPNTFSIYYDPRAINSVFSSAINVYLLAQFLDKAVYYSRESPAE